MTRQEAIVEARKTLGPYASIFDRVKDPANPFDSDTRAYWRPTIEKVGRYNVHSPVYNRLRANDFVYGNGNTWEEALSAAQQMLNQLQR